MQMYLDDYEDRLFWGDPRSPDINTKGMEWFVWAGRTTNNLYTGQAGLFNRTDRPLNHYGLYDRTVTCPLDEGTQGFMPRLFDWVGNSYMFNAVGYEGVGGLAGAKSSSVKEPARTVLFADNILYFPDAPHGWHKPGISAGNVALVDGHVESHNAATVLRLVW
jgi:prepilin-type processing-associated H-X9-DG protein